MINNSQIQAAWIARLKLDRLSTDVVTAEEIREYRWKGTNFAYPNLRVKMGLLVPQIPSQTCQIFTSVVSLLVSSETKSSKQADDIAGVFASRYWGRGFTSEGVKIVKVSLESLGAADVPEENEDIWVSSINFNCMVQAE